MIYFVTNFDQFRCILNTNYFDVESQSRKFLIKFRKAIFDETTYRKSFLIFILEAIVEAVLIDRSEERTIQTPTLCTLRRGWNVIAGNGGTSSISN